eukprot:scaffold13013_cov128-Isochrysis_galbana.AAC.1
MAVAKRKQRDMAPPTGKTMAGLNPQPDKYRSPSEARIPCARSAATNPLPHQACPSREYRCYICGVRAHCGSIPPTGAHPSSGP